jgi:eukaryotic-like serine/threonine-protein kinase
MLPQDPLGLLGAVVADKYAVQSVVAAGGFAVVYRAMHLIWKRPVALKVFNVGELETTQRDRLLEGFVQEGAVLAELSERSAAICQARDIGTITGADGSWVPYMVLEWLEGMTLEAVLVDERRRAMPPRTLAQSVEMLGGAAHALALAHDLGIAHRDVKPGNLFVLGGARSVDCQVKILDFGIAKVLSEAQRLLGGFKNTMAAVTAFTPAYGAPEQFSRLNGSTGPWTDVFALALILVEMASGREPLPGFDYAELAARAADPAHRPTPRTLGVPVSPEVEAVFDRALAVRPADRYPTVGAFWNALRFALGLPRMRMASGASLSCNTLRAIPSPVPPAPPPPPPPVPSSPASDGAVVTVARAPSVARPAAILATLAMLTGFAGASFALVRAHKHAPASAPVALSMATPMAVEATPAATCPSGMVEIPGGKFFMGSDDKAATYPERPAHQVALRPYCIDRFEVTVAAYKAKSDAGECKRASLTNEWDGIDDHEREAFDPLCNARDPVGRANHPINCVDWERADAYCEAEGARLPTEAEWEFAARGSDGRTYPWGDEAPSPERLNACDSECLLFGKKNNVPFKSMFDGDDEWPTTAPVGSFPRGASPFGVEDVAGNVWEWTSDYYAPYTASPASDPTGPAAGSEKVIRGGAWNGGYASWVRPTFRYKDSPAKTSYGIGFRCARDLAPVSSP